MIPDPPAAAGYLYKRVDHNWFARYDPRTNTYDTVPTSSVPNLHPMAVPARVPKAARRADPAGEFRKLLALALIEAFVKAAERGTASAARRAAGAIAALADVPDAARAIGLNWPVAPRAAAVVGVEPRSAPARAASDPNAVSAADLRALPVRLASLTLAQLRWFRAVAESKWNARRFRTSGALEKVLAWANDAGSWKQPVRA